MVSDRIQRHIDRLLDDADDALARSTGTPSASVLRPCFDSIRTTPTLSVFCRRPIVNLVLTKRRNRPQMCLYRPNLLIPALCDHAVY